MYAYVRDDVLQHWHASREDLVRFQLELVAPEAFAAWQFDSLCNDVLDQQLSWVIM